MVNVLITDNPQIGIVIGFRHNRRMEKAFAAIQVLVSTGIDWVWESDIAVNEASRGETG